MAGFANTLITAIVASIIAVLGFLGIILVLALYWSNIVRRIAPNRFPEPMSEKSWPSSRGSDVDSSVLSASHGSSPIPSPRSSPRSSTISNDPVLPKAVLKK
ncbi:hypothetical protein EKO27_g503 [Xylaria grammica]|uniref:Uncharacterized protein n=1 Tax=Xylaria grammica TaxID=363999 RepID=A0A439DJK1_9PEZI|nr:hypothetical protein F5X98DRAFT_6358 [Xylaria grammica]RWA14594.1 hypothetical protein EKO27_g503 [Xylaria grammica]GAW12218.1 hypothetical protein ANO14919_015790 [Xylariales sp. No.14919]